MKTKSKIWEERENDIAKFICEELVVMEEKGHNYIRLEFPNYDEAVIGAHYLIAGGLTVNEIEDRLGFSGKVVVVASTVVFSPTPIFERRQ